MPRTSAAANEAQPRGKVAAAMEGAGRRRKGDQRGRDHRTDTPGTVISRCATGSAFARAAISRSRRVICDRRARRLSAMTTRTGDDCGYFWLLLADQAVAGAGDGFDPEGSAAGLLGDVAQFADHAVDRVVPDYAALPTAIDEVVTRHDAAISLRARQEPASLRLDHDRAGSPYQLARRRSDRDRAEREISRTGQIDHRRRPIPRTVK